MTETLEDLFAGRAGRWSWLFSRLDQYPWFQIKKHRVKQATLYTCLIQDPKIRTDFHRGSDLSMAAAIREALDKAEAE